MQEFVAHCVIDDLWCSHEPLLMNWYSFPADRILCCGENSLKALERYFVVGRTA